MINNIVFLGDIAFNGLISNQKDLNNKRFKQITPILQKAEMVFANLETAIKSGNEKNKYKSVIHSTDKDVSIDLLTRLNITCVSLANNHIYDYKMSGLKATIKVLDELGIHHTGAGWLPKHIEPSIINIEKQTFAFLAYVDKSTNPQTENFSELLINYFDIQKVKEDIQKIKNKVDKIICSIHWGIDYSKYPTLEQIKTAHLLVDSGVDFVMGHHSHTPQAIEKHKNSVICYSLGGLCYGDDLYKGRLRSLRNSTKTSFIPFFDQDFNYINSYKVKEKKGNFLHLKKGDFLHWSKKQWKIFNLAQKYVLIKRSIVFKEKHWDKLYSFLFGYYRNPFIALKDVFSSNSKQKRQ